MNRSLDSWVDYIQTLHFREIDLSLERVRAVYTRLYPKGLPYRVISLSGTNGKGSTAELLASIYHQAEYRVGKFSSPHLVSFNERFDLNGESVDNESLLSAFERVEQARRDTPITFFEFSTLLAIDIFATSKVDIAIMEVGLGGRLDAVNILEPDVAIITSVSIDHTNWLGDTVEQIAREKVGIARRGVPLISGLSKPPQSMLDYVSDLDAELSQVGLDFKHQLDNQAQTWTWSDQSNNYEKLPLPFNQSGVQLNNASLAVKAVTCLMNDFPLLESDIRRGIQSAKILGRCQILRQRPTIILDVSHNQTSVARLAQFVCGVNESRGRVIAVCGMLKDKEIAPSLLQISDQIEQWHVATIDNERGARASDVASLIKPFSDSEIFRYERVEDAYDQAVSALTRDDCLVVFGSFHIVGDILEHIS